MNMSEADIVRMAANARHNALKDAAKAICVFCREGNPWSDAQWLDGGLYEHFQMEDATNKRACAATEIWKLIYAE